MHHRFFTHSCVEGHLGCFHVLAIVNSTAVHAGYMSFSIMVSSCYMPCSGIVGSYDSFIPSFLRNLHNVLHSGCINFTFPPTQQKGFLFSTSSPALIVVCSFFDKGHSDQYKMIPHCSFGNPFSYQLYFLHKHC